VDTKAKATTLTLVDFSESTSYDSASTIASAGYVISQFNKVVGYSLPTQITDYLTYLGYTNIGTVTYTPDVDQDGTANDPGYQVSATDPDGIAVTLSVASSAIDDVHEVTIDGTKVYVAKTDTLETAITAADTTYAAGTHGTYLKVASDGTYVASSGTTVSKESYTTGYYKVSGDLDKGTADTISPATGTYTYATSKTAGTGEKVGGDWYVKNDATLTVTMTSATTPGGTKKVDTFTITAASSTVSGTIVFTQGTDDAGTSKSATLKSFTNDVTVSIGGATSGT
jgi:hypothetical protein